MSTPPADTIETSREKSCACRVLLQRELVVGTRVPENIIFTQQKIQRGLVVGTRLPVEWTSADIFTLALKPKLL
jgi:hypothetical protein